jgi:hypothetical protein
MTRHLQGGGVKRVRGDQLFSFSLSTMLHFVSYPTLLQRSIITMMSDYHYFQSNSIRNPGNGANRRQLPCNAMQTQGILRTVGRQLTALFEVVTTKELLATRYARRECTMHRAMFFT